MTPFQTLLLCGYFIGILITMLIVIHLYKAKALDLWEGEEISFGFTLGLIWPFVAGALLFISIIGLVGSIYEKIYPYLNKRIF